MKGTFCCVCTVALLLLIVSIPAGRAGAQQRTVREFSHTFGVGVWFASGSLTEPGGTGTWRTTLFVLDYKIRLEDSPWGFRLRYGTGGQGSWGGTFAGASGGRDSLWSADVSHRFQQVRGMNLWGFAGYSSFSFESTLPAPTGTRRATSSGFRIGLDAEFPLQVATHGGLSIVGTLAWSPSNSVTSVSGGTTTTASGSATNWNIALRYMFSRPGTTVRPASDGELRPALFTRLKEHDPGIAVEVGFTGQKFSGASDAAWSGPFIGFTYTTP